MIIGGKAATGTARCFSTLNKICKCSGIIFSQSGLFQEQKVS